MLQGVTSFQLDATPTWALSQSASVMPTARSMARAGARSIPSVTSWLRGFIGSSWRGSVPGRVSATPAYAIPAHDLRHCRPVGGRPAMTVDARGDA